MPESPLSPLPFPVTCQTPEEMIALGEKIGALLPPKTTLALIGTLGAGKTHLTKGIVKALGGDPTRVTSPTFNLVNEYPTGSDLPPVHHFDFYRIESPDEVETIGWNDYLDHPTALTIVEWANLFPEMLPPNTISLDITIQTDQRIVTLLT